jgi:glycerol kinase
MGKYILSLDQGTTSSRAIVFDHAGGIVSMAQQDFEQLFPQPGWVEHNPNEIWSTQVAVATQAIIKAGLTPKDIAAIGITNQRETTIVWDKATGKPVYNAIVWQDRRTASYCDELKEKGLDKEIRQKTGLVVDAYFSATKIRWILENVPGARAKAEKGLLAFGTVDSWLIWNLTGGTLHATDITNASRTLIYNIHTLEWDEELLSIFNIPKNMLPEVKASSEVYGETAGNILAGRIPIAGVAGDQQSALFGQLCTKKGMIKNTYGTGCFMLMNIGETPVLSKNNLITTIAWKIDGRVEYAFEGSVFIAGAVVQWLRDGLGIIDSSSDVEALAGQVSDNGGVFFVPAFAGLGAPHWDAHARGTIVGITRGTTAAHIARAALESIALQTMDIVNAMQADAGTPIAGLRVDGGATADNLLMQIQADILNVQVIRPKVIEVTALGAAYLAGLAIGFWKNIGEIAQERNLDHTFYPQKTDYTIELKKGWQRAVDTAKVWAGK